MDDFVLYAAAALGICVAVLGGMVFSQRARLKRFDAKVGIDGVSLSVELHELVRKEVARVSMASLGRLVKVDRELIEFWERGSFMTSEDSARRVGLIQQEIAELERRFREAPPEDKYQLAIHLRELYLKWLEFGRQHFASSDGYQSIRAQVMEGLLDIERIGNAR